MSLSSHDIKNNVKINKKRAGFNKSAITQTLKNLNTSTYIETGYSDALNNIAEKATKQKNLPGLLPLLENINNQAFFQTLHSFSDISPTKQTGKELLQQVIKKSENIIIKKMPLDTDIIFQNSNLNNSTSIPRILKAAEKFKDILDQGGEYLSFDTETLAGQNGAGIQVLDTITEYSFSLHNSSGKVIDEIRNIVGFNEKEVNYWRNELERIGRTGPLNNRDQVILDRFSLVGHSKVSIEDIAGDGSQWVFTNMPTEQEIANTKSSLAAAYRGVDLYEKIGSAQSKTGFYKIREDMKKVVGIINDEKTGIVGHNSIEYDIPILNQFIASPKTAKKIGLDSYLHIDTTNNTHLDTYSLKRFLSDILGKDHLGIDNSKSDKGLNTLEHIMKSTHPELYEGRLAHIAYDDEQIMAQGFFHETIKGSNETLFDRMFSQLQTVMKDSANAPIHKYKGANEQLFSVNSTYMINNFNKKGGLGFVYDPVSATYKTLNGYEVGQNGVKKQSFNQVGPKKRGLYTRQVVALDTKQLKTYFQPDSPELKTYDNMAVNGMYMIIHTPITSQKESVETLGAKQIFTFHESLDSVAYMLGQGEVVGEYNNKAKNTNVRYLEDFSEIKNHNVKVAKVDAKTGAITVKKGTIDDFAEMSRQKMFNDSAARWVRNIDYKKYSKLKSQYAAIDNTIKKITPAEYSKRIAQNLPLIDTTQGELFDAFKFYSFGLKEHTIATESIINSENARKYMNSVKKTMDIIYEQVEKTVGKDYKKGNILFQNVLEDVLEGLESIPNKIMNNKAITTLEEDMQVVQLDVKNLFTKTTKQSEISDGILTLNYKKGSLLNKLMQERYGNEQTVKKNGVHGLDTLSKFIQHITKQESYSEIADELIHDYLGKNGLIQSGERADIIGDKLQRTIASHIENKRKSGDSTFGLIDKSLFYQDVLSENELLANADTEQVKKIVLDSINKNKKMEYIDLGKDGNLKTSSIEKIAEKLININEDEWQKSLKHLNKRDKQTLILKRELEESDLKAVISDLLTGAKNANMDVLITDDLTNPIKIIERNTKDYINAVLPVISNTGNQLEINIAGTKYVSAAFINTKQVSKNKSFNIKDISSSGLIGKAHRESFGFESNIKYSIEDQSKSLLERIHYSSKSIAGKIGEYGRLIERNNPEMYYAQLEYDINELITILPEIERYQGTHTMIDDLQRQGKISSEFSKHIKSLTEMKSPRKRIQKISELMSTERNAFMIDGVIPILHYIEEKSNDKYIQHFAGNADIAVKGSRNNKGKVSVGAVDHGIGNLFNLQSKPTVKQHSNRVLMDKEKVVKQLNDLGFLGNGVELEDAITSEEYQDIMTNITQNIGEAKRTATSSLSVTQLVIDESNAKMLFSKEEQAFDKVAKEFVMNNPAYNKLSPKEQEKVILDVKQSLKNQVKNINLHEQGLVMDTRLYRTAFSNSNSSYNIVKSKKTDILKQNGVKFNINENNLKKLDFVIDTEKFSFKYQDGFFANNREKVMDLIENTGRTVAFNAKRDGFVQGRFYDARGIQLDENDISNIIKKNFGNKKTSSEEIRNFLFKELDYNIILQNSNEPFGSKIFQGYGEKGTVNNLIPVIGEHSDLIKKQLEKLGLERYIGTKATNASLTELYKSIDALASTKKEATSLKNIIASEQNLASKVIFDEILGETNAKVIINQATEKHNHGFDALLKIFNTIKDKQGSILEEDIIAAFPEMKRDIDYKLDKKNGQVILLSDINDFGLDIETLKEHLSNKNIEIPKFEYNGEALGSIIRTPLNQVYDDTAGGYKGRNNQIQALRNLNKKVKTVVQEIQDNSEITPKAKKKQINKYIKDANKEAANIKAILTTSKDIEKGMPYSQRTYLALSRATYSQEIINRLQSSLPAESFEDIVRKTDAIKKAESGGYKIAEGFERTSILEPFIDTMNKTLIYGQAGDLTLQDVVNTGTEESDFSMIERGANNNLERYKYLTDAYKDKNISIKYAESGYMYGSGILANEFNTTPNANIEMLTENKTFNFKEIKMKDVELDTGGVANTLKNYKNNIYETPSVIDLGEEFGDQRFIAIGRTAQSITNDSYVTPKHMDKLKGIQTAYNQYTNENDPTKKEILKVDIQKRRANLIKQQTIDYTGKDSVLTKALSSVRMNQSFRGKADGIYFTHFDDSDKLSKPELIDKLIQTMPDSMNKAKINGKSLIEHYADGVYYDAGFVSTSAFENMGYFDQDLLKRRLGDQFDPKNHNANKEAMMQILETKGDVMMTSRTPEIQEGSIKPTRIFLNRNYADNQASVVSYSAKSMKLDHDGDQFYVSTITTRDGYSVLDRDLGNQKKELSKLGQSTDFYMADRATGSNVWFEQMSQNELQKDVERARKSGQWDEIGKEFRVDGKLYSSRFKNGYTDNEILDAGKRIAPFVESARRSLGPNHEPEELNTAVVNLLKKEKDSNLLIKDFAVTKAYENMQVEAVAKTFAGSIGEVSSVTFRAKHIFNETMQNQTFKDGMDFATASDILQEAMYHVEEHAVISAKKIGNSVPVDSVKNFSLQMNGLMNGQNIYENKSKLKTWMSDLISSKLEDGGIQTILSKNENFAEILRQKNITTPKAQAEYIVDTSLDIIGQYSKNEEATRLVSQTARMWSSISGVDASIANNMRVMESSNIVNQSLMKLAEQGITNNTIVTKDSVTNSIELLASQNLKQYDGREWLRNEASSADKLRQTIAATSDLFTNMTANTSNKSLALGAVGIAASFLVAGFVGGNPAPAQNQAEFVSDEQYYNVPSLQDNSMTYNTSGQQGYAINISAQTSKGRNNIEEALQQAIQQSLPTDVNISMNINENDSNIDSRYIENLLAGAF